MKQYAIIHTTIKAITEIMPTSKFKSAAIIGGGIANAIATWTLLAKHNNDNDSNNRADFQTIHVYNQGSRGVARPSISEMEMALPERLHITYHIWKNYTTTTGK